MTNSVELFDIEKYFGTNCVIPTLNLTVKKGEFITLLGPSGCGKTTLLRMIAGFELPTKGKVLLEGDDITALPPFRRSVNTVFQNYALFPHLNVYENIAYGLKQKGVSGENLKNEVKDALEMVQMIDFINRKPKELSGGQQQRIALARAIVNKPKVLLLDEPLAALDLKLRKQMQFELKQLHQQLGITFVFVTHDQEEALTMSDRIAVMNKGVIEQLAEPQVLYEQPKSKFVADFIGENNTLSGTFMSNKFTSEGYNIPASAINIPENETNSAARKVFLFIRPEHINIYENKPENDFSIEGKIVGKTFLGHLWRIHCQLNNEAIIDISIRPDEMLKFEKSENIFLNWPARKANMISQ